MKFVFDHHALLYMLEQFPQSIATELWTAFVNGCNSEVIVSHREAQKLLEQDAVETDSLEWSKKNSSIFKPTTSKEAKLLGEMMEKNIFDFFATPKLIQRRLPEAIPFILCAAKEQDRVFVFRKNTNIDFAPKIKSICAAYGVECMEVEECLLTLKANE